MSRQSRHGKFAGLTKKKESLSISSFQVEMILKTSMDGFWIVDRGGHIRDVNVAYCSMIGYSREELLHMTISDIEEKETAVEIKAKIKRVGLLGPIRFETRHRRKDGSIIDVEVSAQSLSRKSGVYMAFHRNITRRRRAEKIKTARTRLLLFANNHSLDELLEESLNEAEKLTDSLIGFYHFVDSDQTSLTLQNWSTQTKKQYCKSGGKGLHYNMTEAGVWVDAVIQRKPVIHNDYVTLPHKRGLPPNHATIIRELVVPVIRGDKITAILGVGNKQSDYDDEDVRTVALFADLAWDIAERKIAEESLRASEERVRLAAEGGGVGLWEWDILADRLTWNKRLKTIFGMSPVAEGLTLEQFLSVIHPDDLDATSQLFRKALEHHTEFNHEYRILLPRNRIRWIVVIGKGVYDQNGRPIKMLGCALDISERKAAEEILRLSNRILDTSPEHISVLGKDYKYRHVNRAYVDAHGLPAERITGMHAADLLGQYVFDKLVKPLIDRCMTGEDIHYESWFTFRNYGRRYMSVSYLPLKNNHGAIDSMVVFSRDMTEQKIAEERQKQLEEQLLHAQKMESIGRLSGGLAHDINNMLMPILGYAEVLRMQFPAEDCRREDTEAIIRSANRIRDVVRRLLTFARRQTLELKPLSLGRVVGGLEKMLKRTLRENLRIEMHLARSDELVIGDTGQIEQVILNLAINAQDAMPEGGIIRIETVDVAFEQASPAVRKRLTPGRYVLLSISDTGIGMDRETRQKIFEPFFTTKEADRGTGLGLSTVYGIIQQHGGHIEVESEPGRGSIFRSYFPALKERQIGQFQEKPQHFIRGTETILIAEDQQEVLESMSKMLTMCGYEVLTAKNYEAALSAAGAYEGVIDLLITDVIMPGMHGKALFAELSQIRRGMKVLYMSGYPADVISKHDVLHTETNYIQKPFTLSAITNKIRNVLDGKDSSSKGRGKD